MRDCACVTWLANRAVRFWRDRRGSYSMMAALLLPVLTGFTAFGTEVGLWLHTHQRMQGTADTAAFSAAAAFAMGAASPATEGRAVAARQGFMDGSDRTTVAVNQPPASGPNRTNSSAIEVVIRQEQNRLFSALLGSGPVHVSARAVAVGTPRHVACILGLDPTAGQTVLILNNAVLPDPVCGVASNSSAADGLSVSNNAIVEAGVSSHGGIVTGIAAQLRGSPILRNAPPVPDPYADADAGTPPGCTSQNGTGSNNGSRTLRPDVTVGGVGMARFCGGLNFTNNFQVTFEPGIYFIDTRLIFGNNAVIRGEGVTLVINGNYAINIGNNADVDLRAPSTGPTAGILFFGSRTGTPTVQQTFANNAILNLTGAVYFPNQILNFSNNGTTGPTGGCTQVIGRMVRISNNVTLRPDCADVGTEAMLIGGQATLVE